MNIASVGLNQIGVTRYQNKSLFFGSEEKQEKSVEKAEVSKDTVEIAKEEAPKKSNTGKKWGVGIASAVIPGLGQLINGEIGKGIAMVAGNVACWFMIRKAPKGVASSVGWVGGIALNVYSIVDAVKGVDRKAAKEAAI